MGEELVFQVIVILCGLVFVGIGIAAFRMKRPIHFWSGSIVKAEEVTDVKAYNRANGWMWLVYGSLFFITAILGGYNLTYSGMMLSLLMVPGLFILMGTYSKIEKKYFVKYQKK